jgi:AraC family transcriptional regulator
MEQNWASYETRLNRVTSYIYDHLDEDLDLMRLADVAVLSPYHWHRIYHAVRGETVVGTVKRLRMQRAAVDLAHTTMPLETVATRAGYGSVAAFTRAFGESYGMPPAQYREQGSHKEFSPGRLPSPNVQFEMDIRHVPSFRLATLDHRGDYMEIGKAFEAGMLAARNLLTPDTKMFGVYQDDPALVAEADLRSKAGVTIPAGVVPPAPLAALDVRAGDYAILRHMGPYADMRSAYQWLFGTWLPQSGRDADDAPVLEEYLNNPQDTPPAQLRTDIYLPLKPEA